MANRGILVGEIYGNRFYYLIESDNPNQYDGVIVDGSGRSKFVPFSKTASSARGLRHYKSTPFHEFLWGIHEGEKRALWNAIFITRSRDIPDDLLKGLSIRESFTPGDQKKKRIDKKIKKFKDRTSKKSDEIIHDYSYSIKSLGRTIRGGISSLEAFDANAYDADNDGFVQDATPWMRPALPKIPIALTSGQRSTTTDLTPEDAIDSSPSITPKIKKLLDPATIDRLHLLVEDALNTGPTRATRRVRIDDYEKIAGSVLLNIYDINPQTGDLSSIVNVGSKDLLEVESHAHALGRAVIDLARRRIRYEQIEEQKNIETAKLEERSARFIAIQGRAASYLGVTYREGRFGSIVPRTRLSRNHPPKNKGLLAIHKRLISELDTSDIEKSQIEQELRDLESMMVTLQSNQPVTPDLIDRAIKVQTRHAQLSEKLQTEIRRKRDDIYQRYEIAVKEAFDAEVRSIGGPEFETEYDALNRDIEELVARRMAEQTPRQKLAMEIVNIMQELGLTFGQEKLKGRIPTRTPANEADRKLIADAQELAVHAQDVAARLFPDSIIKQINGTYRKGIKFRKLRGRGYDGLFNATSGTIETSGESSTTAHELMHAAAAVNPFLAILQQLILSNRWIGMWDDKTRSDGVTENLKNGWDEPREFDVAGQVAAAVEDNFQDVYAGRIYPDGSAETLTRALDYLLDKQFYSEKIEVDFDLIASVFGGLIIAALHAQK